MPKRGRQLNQNNLTEPECRPLRDDEYELDGLPKGDLEMVLVPDQRAPVDTPRWLARYHNLPAYLGSGGTRLEAFSQLLSIVSKQPIYRVAITRFSLKNVENQVARSMRAMYAAADLGGETRSSDAVDHALQDRRIRKDLVLKTDQSWKSFPAIRPNLDSLRAAEQIGVKPEHVALSLLQKRHPWEWECLWARQKMPNSGFLG